MSSNNDRKLYARRIKQPNPVLYKILMQVVKILNRSVNTEFEFIKDPAKEPGSIVLIANHASRNDYLFTAPAVYPKRLNYVVGYNEFFRSPVNYLLKIMQAIPKKNFVPDAYCIKSVNRIIKSGGNICIMPEGMSSITGMAQPVIPGIGKLLKKLGVPVYYSKISGGYLTFTKHCLDKRKGKIKVVVDQMFTVGELKELTPEEIEDRMNRLLAHDDYIWNAEEQVIFDGKAQMARNLENLLYLCPRCAAMYHHETTGNRMRCTACGNTIQIDEKYNLSPVGDSVCPKLVTDWTLLERKKARFDVSKPDFFCEGHVKVGVLPEDHYLKGDDTSIISGEGELRLDHEGLHFEGVLEGKRYSFHIRPENLPTFGMCTDISRFYTFVDGRFIEFYPDSNDVLRWDMLTEELHRVHGGKWQDTRYRHEW